MGCVRTTVEELLIILNKNPEKKHTQLQRDISKYITSINENTDIEVKQNADVVKMRKDKDGKIIEIVKKSFTIIRIKPYPEYIKNANKINTKQTDTDKFREQALRDLEKRKNDKRLNKKYGVIKNEEAWLKKAISKLMEEEQKKQQKQDKEKALQQEQIKINEHRAEEELEKSKKLIDELLENEKNKLKDEIDESKGIPLIIFEMYNDLDNTVMTFYINQEYQYIEVDNENPKCENANETYKYLMKYSEDLSTVIKHTKEFYDIYEKMYLK